MERKYWLHRIKCGNNAYPYTYQLLHKHSIISIGWSDFSDDNYMKKLTENWNSFNRVFVEENRGLPRNRTSLWRFLKEMKQGDYVIVPQDYGFFGVYEIENNEIFNNQTIDKSLWEDWNAERACLKDGYPVNRRDEIIDMGFYRKVKCVAINIPRQDYADQALYSRLKILSTNADISDLADSVENAISSFNDNKPINLKNNLIDATSVLVRDEIKKSLNDQKLEKLVQWYLISLGASSVNIPPKNTSPSSEGDADVVAIFNNLQLAILVQVKAHSGYTNKWAVEQISSYKKYNKEQYNDYTIQTWVVSTCDDFSDEAKLLASAEHVRLINGETFASMIIGNGIKGLSI